MAGREIWFEYWRERHRVKAIPVHWKGWVSLIALVAAPTLLMLATSPVLLARFGRGITPLLVFLALTVSLCGVLAVVMIRGRPRRP